MVVHQLPALELLPLAPSATLPRPEDYDVVVFVSRYAVQRYLSLLAASPAGAGCWPPGTIAATVGASSAQALFESGIVPAACIVHPAANLPSQDSEALLAVMQERRLQMRRVLIVRGTEGRAWLARKLAEGGVQTDFLPVYERAPARWPAEAADALAAALERPVRCVFLLTSSEGVRAVARRMGELGLLEAWSQSAFVVLHERIGATLQSVLASQSGAGVRRLELCMPDESSIVEAIRAVARSTAKP